MKDAFAKECWLAKRDEFGTQLVSYKVNGQRIMEVPLPDTTSVSEGAEQREETVKTKKARHGENFTPGFLGLHASVESDLGQGKLDETFGPNFSDEDEDDADGDGDPQNQQDGAAFGALPDETASDEDDDDPDADRQSVEPPEDDDEEEEAKVAPAVAAVGTPKRPVGAARCLNGTPASAAGSVSGRSVRSKAAPAPPASAAGSARSKRSAGVPGMVAEPPGSESLSTKALEPEGTDAESIRRFISEAPDDFEESIDMWRYQDCMTDLMNATNESHKVLTWVIPGIQHFKR